LAFGQNEFQRRQEERFAAEQKRIELERMKAMSALDTLRQIELETIYIHISGAGHPERSYLHMRQYLPRALSVRQVLEKTAIDSAVVRKELLPQLHLMLVDSTDGYKERHHAAFLEKLKKPGTSVLTSIKSQSERLAVAQATVATYLLGEFRDFESLPFLLEVYRDDRNGRRSPVPRVLVFAVMDQLTRFHPTGLLSPESRVLRKAYLTATKDLPRGYPHVVPTVAGE
jgi:hypothetical protein